MVGEVKAVFLDVDDTLVRSDPNALPSDEVVAAIHQAKEAKVATHLVTGRPWRFARHVARALKISDYCVVNGGATIIDPLDDKEPYLQTPLTNRGQRTVLEIARQLGLDVYDSVNQYGGRPIEDFSDIVPGNPKLFMEGVEPDAAEEVIKGIISANEDYRYRDELVALASTSWKPGEVVDIHITDATATKKGAVETILDIRGLSKDEVIGVGDSPIDLPLFESVGLSIAMGNAPAHVKAAADEIAPSLEEDGVAWVFRKFVLSSAEARVFPVGG